MQGEIYRPAASANGDFICLCAGADSYISTMCIHMSCCVSTHLYECFSVCVVWMDHSVQSCPNISACTCIFFSSNLGFYRPCALVDEVMEEWRVSLLLPTSGQLPAGFPQNIKFSRLPVASVITPPIRTKSEEEYQWVKRVRRTKRQ